MTKAEQRKKTPIYQGVLKYFPNAMGAVARVSRQGNVQHDTGDPDGELVWDKNKSNDHEDCLVRHLIDHSQSPMDDDGHLHLTKVAWRALAALEIYLSENQDD